MVTSLGSKWAAGKARGGRISKAIRNRRATQPPAHFQRNPLGRGRLAVFPRCSLLTYRSRYARRSRLEKQPTDLRRKPRDLGDRTLALSCLHPQNMPIKRALLNPPSAADLNCRNLSALHEIVNAREWNAEVI